MDLFELDSLPPIVFISLENWDDIWRRNQFVCAELSRRWPRAKILFVGLPRDLSNAARTLKFGRLRRSEAEAIDGCPGIIATYPLKLLPDSLPVGRAVNEALFAGHIRRAVRRLGMSRPLLWINSHAAVHLLGRLDECGVIYDVTDDWTELNQPEAVRKRTIEQDSRLCRHADAVIVCSQRLLEMKRLLSSNVHLIPNGVDVNHYTGIGASGPMPAEAAEWERPVYGYTGTVHPDRVDVELLASLSERIERGSLIFVGPNHIPLETMARITGLGNVHFTGPVAYRQIPDYMRAFDVCMVPHLVSPFTESLNPIKLWEYLAAGKPIVSTPVAGFRDYPQFVRLASTAEEFEAALMAAPLEDARLPEARQAEAAKHSWSSRVDQIEAVIAKCVKP